MSKEERERRLLFLAHKMLEGVPRRLLVVMAMECFAVQRRTAQKYVQAVENRLARRAAHENPLFYLELTKEQRNGLLQEILARAQHPEKLDAKDLSLLASTANKIMDSRDRAAAALFQIRNGTQPRTTAMLHVEAKREDEPKMLRDSPKQLTALTAEPLSQQDLERGGSSANG